MKSKAHPTAHTQPRLILYVAATDEVAEDGAAALEDVPAGADRAVHPTASIEEVTEWTPEVDCIVYEGDDDHRRAAIADASGSTPLVVFADGPYAAAESDDVDGYVRRDTGDAYVHLVDEIDRLAATAPDDAASSAPLDDRTAAAVFETTADIASCRSRDRLFDRLVDGATDVLEFEYCWLATINFGELVPRAAAPAVPDEALEPTSLENPLGVAFRAREPIRIDDLETYEWIEPPFEGARSLCSVPVGDVGVLHVASEQPGAFDRTDLALLEGLCGFAAAILERNWAERGVINERDRLRRERDRLRERHSRLEDERDALFTLFRNVSEPTLRYDVDEGEPVVSGVNATFEAVFGVDRDAVVGDSVTACALPSGLADPAAELREAIAANERRDLEVQRRTPDGIRDFVVTVVPLDVEDGTPAADDGDAPAESVAGGMLVYEDVTRRQRLERQLLAASRRLDAIADRVDDDVRAPLNTARGYLELAEKTGDDEHFDVVEDAHEQLSDRLQDLVGVAEGETDLREPVDLRSVATRAWIAGNTGEARLVTEGDLVLEADRDALFELFEHVLQTTVELEGDDDSSSVTVTVGATDDGFYVAGSHPADADDEAEPDTGWHVETPSTEVGLEVVQRIADAHGWDVGVAEDDDGTAIAFRGVDILERE